MLNSEHGVPLTSEDSWNVAVATPKAFLGLTTNERGNDGGTGDPHTLFTVTGDVIVRVFGFCTVSLVGATATVQVGVAGNTAELIALATATDIAANDIWLDGTPDDVLAAVFSDVKAPTLIMGGANIIETVATADVETGNIRYVCLWRPVSSDGKVTGSSGV